MTVKLTEMEEDFLRCRYANHRCEWLGFYRFKHKGQAWIASEFTECEVCGWTKVYLLDRSFTVQHRLYKYPDGYLLEYDEAEDHFHKSDYARVLVKRHGIYADQATLEKAVKKRKRR